MSRLLTACILAISACITIGCGGSHVAESPAAASGGQEPLDTAQYVLNEEPVGAVGVMAAREESQNMDEIVVVGRIGGRKDPWIDGRAAFMVIDAAMTIVADSEDSGEDQVCMDDCCASLRAECTTLVKIVDDGGTPLAIDAREVLGADVNDMVVVKGVVQRDEDGGTFTIAASGVYVRR